MEIAIDASDETSYRAASALVSHPDVMTLGLVGRRPPQAWGKRAVKVEDLDAYSILVTDRALQHQGTLVTTAGSRLASTVSHASSIGLLRALGSLLGTEAVTLYRTVPGRPSKIGRKVWFPEPIGRQRVARAGNGVDIITVQGPIGGILATTETTMLAVVDDYQFLEAACVGAGALLAGRGLRGAVWTHPQAYLNACSELGIVVSEAATDGS